MADKYRHTYECVGGHNGDLHHGFTSWMNTNNETTSFSACPECGFIQESAAVEEVDPPLPNQAKVELVEEHDPLSRILPDEPHLILLARDFRSPHLSLMYAAIRERRFDHARQILDRLEAVSRAQPPQPHKDKEHAWSARAVAQQMDQWRLENMRAEPPAGRVNTAPERGDVEPDKMRTDYSDIAKDDAGTYAVEAHHAAIKAARPTAEPDEAT